jgi:transcriptional regulator with XRE-family HTH domain
MDVQVDGELIRAERARRAWSQEHLAGAAGIGVRTVQRIEATGVASYESLRAISAALEIPVVTLRAAGAAAEAPPRSPAARLRMAARWLGAVVAIAVVAGAGGFFLLHDYQKVRVLRTVEQWVTAGEPAAAAATRPDSR